MITIQYCAYFWSLIYLYSDKFPIKYLILSKCISYFLWNRHVDFFIWMLSRPVCRVKAVSPSSPVTEREKGKPWRPEKAGEGERKIEGAMNSWLIMCFFFSRSLFLEDFLKMDIIYVLSEVCFTLLQKSYPRGKKRVIVGH